MQDNDPLDVIEQLLEQWGSWRRGANHLNLGFGPSVLARLVAEGAEHQRREVKPAYKLPTRAMIDGQIWDKEAIPFRDWPAHVRAEYLFLFGRGRTPQAWASMVTATGPTSADKQTDLEETIELAIAKMPGELRAALRVEYMTSCSTEQKAKMIRKRSTGRRPSRAEFYSMLRAAKWWLHGHLDLSTISGSLRS